MQVGEMDEYVISLAPLSMSRRWRLPLLLCATTFCCPVLKQLSGGQV
jgi:hypothetical protein